MNNIHENVDSQEMIDWVNEAIKQKARIVAIVMDEENHNTSFEARYLNGDEKKILKEIIQFINQDNERYSLRFAIDVVEEIQKSINTGEAIFNYEEAKNIFPELHI